MAQPVRVPLVRHPGPAWSLIRERSGVLPWKVRILTAGGWRETWVASKREAEAELRAAGFALDSEGTRP